MDFTGVKTQEALWVELALIDLPEYARPHSPESLKSLADSLGRIGQLQNVVLVPKPAGRYEVVVGVGRIEAAGQIGWQKIRADVKEGLSEMQSLALVLAENEEREDVSPFYTASMVARMFKASGLTQQDFAKEVGKDPAVISRYLLLAGVPADVWKDYQTGLTSLRQCVEIAKVKDINHQKQLAEACAREGLSGAVAKKRAQALASGKDAKAPSKKEKTPQASFTFSWKGNGILVKGRLFKPHAEAFCSYTNEMSDAYDKFVEAEKSHPAAAA